jgi:hypothetical protein
LGYTLGHEADPEFTIHKQKPCPSPGESLALYQLNFTPFSFVHCALTGMKQLGEQDASDDSHLDPDTYSTWIPELILEVTVPETLQTFKLSVGSLFLPCHPSPVSIFLFRTVTSSAK